MKQACVATACKYRILLFDSFAAAKISLASDSKSSYGISMSFELVLPLRIIGELKMKPICSCLLRFSSIVTGDDKFCLI